MPKEGSSFFSLRGVLVAVAAIILLALGAVAVLSRYAEPWIRQQLLSWAERNGYEKVEVTGVDIGLVPLRAAVQGLVMESGGRKVIEVEKAGIEARLGMLISGDLRIERVSLKGARILIDVEEDGTVHLAGLTLGRGESEKKEAGKRGGEYRIDLLKITDSSLHVSSPNLQATLHVSDLEFREGRELAAGTVSLRGIKLTSIHNTDNTWQLLSSGGGELATLGAGEERSRGGLSRALEDLSLSIERLEITDDSTVTFRQMAPGDEYETTYRLDRAFITDIRSASPDGPSPFVWEATSLHHEHLLLEGKAFLFKRPFELSLTGTLEGLELVPLSPFMKRAAGFAIDSGQADGDIDLRVSGGELEGLADIRVNLLTVSTHDKGILKEFEKGLPKKIKLETALRLLSDREGVIRLKVPVSGDASAPTFGLDLDIDQAINNALGNVVKTGLFVAAPWAVATYKALTTKRPAFQEVLFAPGSDEIDESGGRVVAEFAREISGKKGLLALVCGFVVERELSSFAGEGEKGGDRNRLALDLAVRRAWKVKDLLVAGHDIEARRLILCRPEMEYWDRSTVLTDPFGDQTAREPRVELR